MIVNIQELSENDKILIKIEKEIEISKDFNVINNIVNISLEGYIQFKDSLYCFKAMTSVKGVIPCARCLEPTKFNDDFEIEEKFTNTTTINNGDTEVLEFKGHLINLEDTIISSTILNLPFRKTCKEGCLGLCIHCGINLNEKKCKCEKPIDPRFESLLSLIEENQEV